ncbi:unnamed protein product, partial [Darwinula stevensoni]
VGGAAALPALEISVADADATGVFAQIPQGIVRYRVSLNMTGLDAVQYLLEIANTLSAEFICEAKLTHRGYNIPYTSPLKEGTTLLFSADRRTLTVDWGVVRSTHQVGLGIGGSHLHDVCLHRWIWNQVDVLLGVNPPGGTSTWLKSTWRDIHSIKIHLEGTSTWVEILLPSTQSRWITGEGFVRSLKAAGVEANEMVELEVITTVGSGMADGEEFYLNFTFGGVAVAPTGRVVVDKTLAGTGKPTFSIVGAWDPGNWYKMAAIAFDYRISLPPNAPIANASVAVRAAGAAAAAGHVRLCRVEVAFAGDAAPCVQGARGVVNAAAVYSKS